MKALLFVSLLSSLALAQVGVCKPGVDCTSRSFKASRDGTAAAPSWGWTSDPDTGLYRSAANSVAIAAGGALQLTIDTSGTTVSTGHYFAMGSTSRILLDDGATAALPGLTFAGDQNTGLYKVAADNLSVTTGGVRSFNFTSTAGKLEGTATQPTLILDTSSGACLDYNSSSRVCTASNVITFSNGASGEKHGGAGGPTTWATTTYSPALIVDSNTGRPYWLDVVQPSNQRSAVDLGGFPHPVLQQRTYALDMGYESAVTPTFYPVAPRLGASAATATPTDAAAASTNVIGTTPNQYDARTSNTTAAAGSISSLVTTAFIRRASASPRWCQKVSMSTTANIRVWLGVASALPGSNDNPANSGQSFRYSTTAGDTKWMACYANGVGSTCVDTAKAPSSGTSAYDTLCIDCREGGTTRCTWWVNGVATNTITTGLGAGYPFFPYYSVEARSAAAVSLYAGPLAVEIY